MSPACGDRDADLADLAAGELVIGVIAGLGRQVEGDREAGLALLEVARGTARWSAWRPNAPRTCASSRADRARAAGTSGSQAWRHCMRRGPSADRATMGAKSLMPDQSSAATEHAILQEITAPLQTLPDDPVAAVRRRFPGRAARVRPDGGRRVRPADQPAGRRAAGHAVARGGGPPGARAGRRADLGDPAAGARRPPRRSPPSRAARPRTGSSTRGSRRPRSSPAREQRVKDLDADTDRIWIERHRIVDDARELAQQLLALADAAAERFPAGRAGAPSRRGRAPSRETELYDEAAASRPSWTSRRRRGDDPAWSRSNRRRIDDRRQPTNEPSTYEDRSRRARDRLMHLGRERVIGCWQVGDVLIDPGPTLVPCRRCSRRSATSDRARCC